jgi:hypothetical protein
MTLAGYSGTPLPQKLGIKPGQRLMLLNAPDGFDETLGVLPEGVDIRRAARGSADVIVLFTKQRALLERRIDALGAAVFPDGAIWVAWPKKAAGVPTDMTENVVREVCLPRGLVDNKVCAIDDVWSGLRVVHRVERRKSSR